MDEPKRSSKEVPNPKPPAVLGFGRSSLALPSPLNEDSSLKDDVWAPRNGFWEDSPKGADADGPGPNVLVEEDVPNPPRLGAFAKGLCDVCAAPPPENEENPPALENAPKPEPDEVAGAAEANGLVVETAPKEDCWPKLGLLVAPNDVVPKEGFPNAPTEPNPGVPCVPIRVGAPNAGLPNAGAVVSVVLLVPNPVLVQDVFAGEIVEPWPKAGPEEDPKVLLDGAGSRLWGEGAPKVAPVFEGWLEKLGVAGDRPDWAEVAKGLEEADLLGAVEETDSGAWMTDVADWVVEEEVSMMPG